MKLNRSPVIPATKFVLLSLLSLLLTSVVGYAQQSASKQLADLLINMKTMTATFQQQTFDSKGKLLQTSRGKVEIKRPNKFRWDIKTPNPQLIVSDGKRLWIYDIDLDQVSVQSMQKRTGDRPALLLSGDVAPLFKEYTVALTIQTRLEKTFFLKAKSEEALFESMQITFAEKQPIKMRFKDSLGHKSIIRFQRIRLNKPVSARRFQFKPPRGVDVIQES